MELSIIVVSFNTRETLRECLASLPSGCEGISWESIVVDNASRDGTPAFIASHFPEVRLIANHHNVGFGRACNQAAKEARGDHLLFLNSDARVPSGAVALLVRYAQRRPDAAAVGPRLVASDGRLSSSCFRFPTLWRPELNMRLLRRMWGERFSLSYPADDPRLQAGGEVDWLSGACLLVRRDFFHRVGGFDERFFLYFEDIDLCRRLVAAGARVLYWPGTSVIHISGVSASGHEKPLHYELQRSRLVYYSIHHRGPALFITRLFVLAGALVRSLHWVLARRGDLLPTERRILGLALCRFPEPRGSQRARTAS